MASRLAVFVSMLVPTGVLAAGGTIELEQANNNFSNLSSLQRGASYFTSYCYGCHSARYVRFNRLQADLDIGEEQLKRNFMFAADKPHDTMTTAMPADKATVWFGQSPPDLSLAARSRGTDWIYTYLKNFYVDESRPLGVNNRLLPGASMPHALWELEGLKRAVFAEHEDAAGNVVKLFDRYETVTPGLMSGDEYEQTLRDLVNFLEYISEPVKIQRQRLGLKVILFLVFFLVLTYFLKREYWKDVN